MLYVAVHGRIVGIVGIVGSVRGLALRIVAERGAIELRLVKLGGLFRNRRQRRHARHGRGFGCRGCMRSCRGGRSVLGGWSGWHRRCCVLIGRSSVRSAIRVAVRSVGGCRGWGRSAIRVCGGHCRSRRRHCRCRSGCRIRISGWRRNSRCVRVGDRCRSAVRGVLCGCGRWHARGWGVAVAGCRIVEACAGWIGLLGHEHNEHDRRGQACDETDDQQEYAGCASRADPPPITEMAPSPVMTRPTLSRTPPMKSIA